MITFIEQFVTGLLGKNVCYSLFAEENFHGLCFTLCFLVLCSGMSLCAVIFACHFNLYFLTFVFWYVIMCCDFCLSL